MDLWGARDASISSLPPCLSITANTSYWMARAERSRMLCRDVAENIWRDDVHLVPGQMGCFCFCGPFDQNVVSNERRQRDESSKDGQCPAEASGQEAGTHPDSQDAQEKAIPSSCVLTSAVMCLVPMVSPVQMVVLLLISIGFITVLNRRMHRKGSQYGGAALIMPVSSEQRTGREVSERQDTGGQGEAPASTTPAQPEVRRQLPISLVLSDVIDDDPGAYMRSLHCDEIARIFRQSMTPILQIHVTSGHLSEEASAELLERHARETRDLADDWMGRWQRGVSETLSLSDVWITLLRMRKAALLQEVQGLAGNANRGA